MNITNNFNTSFNSLKIFQKINPAAILDNKKADTLRQEKYILFGFEVDTTNLDLRTLEILKMHTQDIQPLTNEIVELMNKRALIQNVLNARGVEVPSTTMLAYSSYYLKRYRKQPSEDDLVFEILKQLEKVRCQSAIGNTKFADKKILFGQIDEYMNTAERIKKWLKSDVDDLYSKLESLVASSCAVPIVEQSGNDIKYLEALLSAYPNNDEAKKQLIERLRKNIYEV